MNKKWAALLICSLLFSFAGLSIFAVSEHNRVRYGFVNTEKLMDSFVESQKVTQELQKENDRWRADSAVIGDSLAAFEMRMAAEYDAAPLARKAELKKEQVRRMEEAGRFEQARANKMQRLRLEKLQVVYQKINAALADFAADRGIDVIFASSNGSIVYGDGSRADLTAEFSHYLNERFR